MFLIQTVHIAKQYNIQVLGYLYKDESYLIDAVGLVLGWADSAKQTSDIGWHNNVPTMGFKNT